MKTIYSLKACSIFLAAAWFTGPGLVSPAFADAYIVDLNSKKVTDLGSDVVAHAINDAGQVLGDSSSGHFITGPNGQGRTYLWNGMVVNADAINDAGQVAGGFRTTTGQFHAFITGPNGQGMTDLGTLGGDSSIGYDINRTGQVVGRLRQRAVSILGLLPVRMARA